MNRVEGTSFVLFPQGEIEQLKSMQLQILEAIKTLHPNGSKSNAAPTYLTAVEFMRAVKICRSKFDQLSATSKIRVIKKKRKLYVPFSEVERYFTDPSIG
ncbi:MAG: hypothetical protein EOO10_14855 [Chitinophagaceae bacterium]|nr:MAG: hypothetical protein EOO10_14855 [Chitinophagaceae bacterium]